MCETCGCGKPEGFTIRDPKTDPANEKGHELDHHHKDDHIHNHDHDHDHDHDHHHDHPHSHSHSHGQGHENDHGRVIELNRDIMAGNNITASMNRRFLEGRKVLCLNMVSSPGSGKTTILEKTISTPGILKKIYVIEGDQQTLIDAVRIEKTGAPVLQINTGSACHLDARMIESALERMDPEPGSVLFIENVGNLVCPAMFDLGEFRRVLTVSVTEGEDKPLKYPGMFETSNLCLVNKSDLLPYVDFSTDDFIRNAMSVNPDLEFITLSAKTGEGMDAWYRWINDQYSLSLGK
jgi:hydrogenase nickel incorporation protein HypB